ncbi:MAG: M23 family metallopeptidase [FCB group bacterium]|nr:M23 family metallopeptidase [FCB group bacterium]
MIPNIIFIVLLGGSFIFGQSPLWPTDAGRSLSSNFGEFRDNHFHMGLDIKTNGKEGFPVYAVADGFISRMVANFNGYGKALYLTTNENNIAVYSHLSRFSPILENALEAQQMRQMRYHVDRSFSPTDFPVKRGDVIGYTGNTGASSAPHLHFELRDMNNRPLNPLSHGFSLPDRIAPTAQEIAFIPLFSDTWINGNPLPQTFPLFRDRGGIYYLPDTINCSGTIGLAIKVFDRRQGASNVYQLYRVELLVDNNLKYDLIYDQLDYDQSRYVNTVVDYRLKRLNLGEFQKLYRLDDYPKLTIHKSKENGILTLPPGYHDLQIRVFDQAGNSSTIKGTVFINPPSKMKIESISRSNEDITFHVQPAFGSIPIESVTAYSFTPYGFADEQVDPLEIIARGKDYSIRFDRRKIERKIIQFIGVNKLGAYALPIHWAADNTARDILDVNAELKLSQVEDGLFLQVQTSVYSDANVALKIHKPNRIYDIPLLQVQPTVFLSSRTSPVIFDNMNYIEVVLTAKAVPGEIRKERIIKFKKKPSLAIPGKTVTVLSNDRLCSIRATSNSVYDTTILWIDVVENNTVPTPGNQLSKVYQLQPFELPLKDSIQIGIRYSKGLKDEKHLGIYTYDSENEHWTYLPTYNRVKRQVLTASASSLDAVTVIQDLTPPVIRKVFPENNGFYNYRDVQTLRAIVDDELSGIDSREEALAMVLDGNRLIIAYQPVKKELSYRLATPLEAGPHELVISIADQSGNVTTKTIKFAVD